MPEGLALDIDWNAWEIPQIFKLIQKAGEIDDEEMRKAFNLGIGMIIVCDEAKSGEIMELLKEENPVVVGKIVKA